MRHGSSRWFSLSFVLVVFPCQGALHAQQEVAAKAVSVNYARPKSLGNFFKPYLSPSVPETSLANSPRLSDLIRDGKLQLSVEDAVALALENNLDVVAASYEPAIAQTDVLRAKAGGATRGVAGAFQSTSLFAGAIGGGVSGGGGGGGGAGGASGGGGGFTLGGGSFDPAVSFSYGWNQNTVPLGITILQGVPVVTTHTASYSYYLGQAFTTGTSFGVGLFAARQSTTGVTSLFNPQIPTQLAIGFTQPLLNGFGRRVNARFIRVAANEVRFADSSFRQKVMTTVGQLLGLYWDVVAAREHVDVAQKALELSEKTLTDTSQEVKLGVIARFEEVRAAAEVSRQRGNLVRTRADYEQKEEQLKTLIAKHVVQELATAEILPSGQLPEPKPDDIPTLAEALRQAAANRPEIEQADLNLRNQGITTKATRNAMLPSLNIFATYAPQGLSGERVLRDAKGDVVRVESGGVSEALSQTFRNQYPDYFAGFSLSIPLRNRTAQADLARALLEQRVLEAKLRQQKEMVDQEVRRAVIAVTEAKEEIEAARSGVEMARQTLEGEQKKFQLGESEIFRIVLAQRDLATAEDTEVTARANYAKALVQYQQATATILEKNQIEIGGANQGRSARPS